MSERVDPKRFLQLLRSRMHNPSSDFFELEDWMTASLPEFTSLLPREAGPTATATTATAATASATACTSTAMASPQDAQWHDIESVLSSSQTYKAVNNEVQSPTYLDLDYHENFQPLNPEVLQSFSAGTSGCHEMEMNLIGGEEGRSGCQDFYPSRETSNSRTATPLTRGPTPNSPFDDNLSLYTGNYNFQTAITEDLPLVEAAFKAEAEGVKTPLIKEELRYRIQRKRKASGLDELEVKEEPQKPEVLTELDLVRRERRKASNRKAATKCREKKRKEEERKQEERKELEVENQELRLEVSRLRDQLSTLKDQLLLHQSCGLIQSS